LDRRRVGALGELVVVLHPGAGLAPDGDVGLALVDALPRFAAAGEQRPAVAALLVMVPAGVDDLPVGEPGRVLRRLHPTPELIGPPVGAGWVGECVKVVGV